MKQNLKSKKKRTLSQRTWLTRQINDPYVQEAGRKGYRSRAAFKLEQLDDRFHFLKKGGRVADLGAAPGGWTQVAAARVKAVEPGGGHVAALDILPMDPVPGATVLLGDFLAEGAEARLKEALGGPADVVLSDMAAPTTGHTPTDHLRIMHLAETALEFAKDVLAPGGCFVAKLLQGGAEKPLLDALKQSFATVRHAKPPASRADSKETYVVAMGFRSRPQ
ncbi:MAG: RlmE family RNA methyltransferase [Alphaproteobacteria bacterium]|nr:RlmE family RNA methyltransferase [Alphaproteobacteria bacterium]